MKKRVISLLLASAMVMSMMAGCGSSQSAAPATDTPFATPVYVTNAADFPS